MKASSFIALVVVTFAVTIFYQALPLILQFKETLCSVAH